MQRTLEMCQTDEAHLRTVAEQIAGCDSCMFIGRGAGYPLAAEGALKLKEISYVHAEAYAAGELKHGPIALLDPRVPLFAMALHSRTYDKLISNVQEVRARDARVIAVATEGDEGIRRHADEVFYVPDASEALSASWASCRCNYSRTTSRWPAAAMSISRAISPSPSPSNRHESTIVGARLVSPVCQPTKRPRAAIRGGALYSPRII